MFLNEPEIICLHIVKWFVVLLFNILNPIYQQFLSNLMLIICLPTVKWSQVLLFNTNNSIQHYSLACTQLNGFKYSVFIVIFSLLCLIIVVIFVPHFSCSYREGVCAELVSIMRDIKSMDKIYKTWKTEFWLETPWLRVLEQGTHLNTFPESIGRKVTDYQHYTNERVAEEMKRFPHWLGLIFKD